MEEEEGDSSKLKNAFLAGCIAIGTIMIYAGIEIQQRITLGLINVPTFVGYGLIASGIGFIVAPLVGTWLSKRAMRHTSQEKLCRKCGLHKPLALEYDTDGLCRECLMELVELQKEGKGK